MPTYTVVALLDLDTEPPDMLIAGVLEGEHNMVDTDPGTVGDGFQRYATDVEAENADDAERIALEQYETEHADEDEA